MKLLVPVDGSETSSNAVKYAISRVKSCAGHQSFELHLVNVQPPMHGTVGMFVGGGDLKEYHRDEGMKALAAAQGLLNAAGVQHQLHIEVGPAGEIINRYAKDLAVDEIIMGTRGLGNVADLLLGSTSEDVLRGATVPVVLVR